MIGEVFKNIGKEIADTSDVNKQGQKVDIGKRIDVKECQGDSTNKLGDVFKRLSPEKNIEVNGTDPVVKLINNKLETVDSVKGLLESLPEGKEKVNTLKKCFEIIDDPKSSDLEVVSANSKISNIKGELLEVATKKSLAEVGFTVSDDKVMVNGKSGPTIPDVVAVNNTKKSIEALGRKIKPEEKISAECKCGTERYINKQLDSHIPNQLSGQSGEKTLITTSDVANVKGKAEDVCKKYDAKLASVNVSNSNIIENLKGAVA